MSHSQNHTIVIGAGIGGLTTAALLLKAGYPVTVLEAHVYPGGSAGTFYHKKFRFDAGATLAGGFSPGGPHHQLAEKLGLTWPIHPVDPAWTVHLPDKQITQWADPEQWREERLRAFPNAEKFWRLQELLADISWDISSRPFPWPPQAARDLVTLAKGMRPRTFLSTPYLFSTIADLIPKDDPDLKTFLDAQLLIAAQTTSEHTTALYGSAALDLPRRGVNHVEGGIGNLAVTLVDWIRENGGDVLYRQEVEEIVLREGRAVGVRTNKGLDLSCDWLVANQTPWGLAALLGEGVPADLAQEVEQRESTWGAFMLYVGANRAVLEEDGFTHHQVVVDTKRPLGETNSVFVSIADPADPKRGPDGQLAITMSTHTDIAPWWKLRYGSSRTAYEDRKAEYAEKMLAAAEIALPRLRQEMTLCKPGTPVTFQFYTRRPGGMVGGFPQTSIFKTRGPNTSLPNLWLVGDSIFPGQSTAGVTLGGMRVADTVLHAMRQRRTTHHVRDPHLQEAEAEKTV